MGFVAKLPIERIRHNPQVRRAARGFFAQMHDLERRFMADSATREEESKLQRSWAVHDPEMLDQYLVSGYQDPHINAQSILVRHLLVSRLFGSEFADLQRAELAFAVELNEQVRQRAAELGVKMGSFLDPAKYAAVQRVTAVIADRVGEFAPRWREALAGREAQPLSVLEFACGSANDYRSLVEYGIAPFLDYRGVDLNEDNIANAKSRFPDVSFEVGSILDLPYGDRSVDYVLAFDIFEHLSLQAMGRALEEAFRLSRRGVVLSFFNMTGDIEHLEQPKGSYHWNVLSAPRVEEVLEKHYEQVDVTHIPTYLKEHFEYPHSYNKKAWTMVAEGPR